MCSSREGMCRSREGMCRSREGMWVIPKTFLPP